MLEENLYISYQKQGGSSEPRLSVALLLLWVIFGLIL